MRTECVDEAMHASSHFLTRLHFVSCAEMFFLKAHQETKFDIFAGRTHTILAEFEIFLMDAGVKTFQIK